MHNELKVLGETSHPNIMRIFGLLEDKMYYYIVSEVLEGGELYDRIVELRNFNERDAAQVTNQLLLAINYMHAQNIIHRDLKPENILLVSTDQDNLEIKLTDFGFACFFDKDQGLQDVLGSPLYMAPEICTEDAYDDKVDVWSIGVIAFVLLTGRPPFKGGSKDQIFEEILEKNLDLSKDPAF